MKKHVIVLLCFLGAAILVGCGGGGGGSVTSGGGGTTSGNLATAIGRVVWVETGASPLPSATIQIDSASAQTATDGSFVLQAPVGATSLLVVYQQTPSVEPVSFRYDIPALSGTTDVGDLFIGPQKVVVTGRAVDSETQSPIAGAQVHFAGRKSVTGQDGTFSLLDVAYSASNPVPFFAIEGRITATGYLPKLFQASTEAANSQVSIGDVQISPLAGEDPPPLPATIYGTISPSSLAPGTIVKLMENGNLVRQFLVGTDGQYGFFVVAGNYVLSFENPTNGASAPDMPVELLTPSEPIRIDVTIQ